MGKLGTHCLEQYIFCLVAADLWLKCLLFRKPGFLVHIWFLSQFSRSGSWLCLASTFCPSTIFSSLFSLNYHFSPYTVSPSFMWSSCRMLFLCTFHLFHVTRFCLHSFFWDAQNHCTWIHPILFLTLITRNFFLTSTFLIPSLPVFLIIAFNNLISPAYRWFKSFSVNVRVLDPYIII